MMRPAIGKRAVTCLGVLATALAAQPGMTEPFTSEQLPESPMSHYTHGDDNAVDYRHMGLYQLKQHRYLQPSSASGGAEQRHIHHHDYWGPGWGYSGGYYQSDGASSFADRVSDGLVSVAVVAAVAAVAAGIAYGTSQALFTLWPYQGATSLTAIELPADSPWKITGYKTAHGSAITLRDFSPNQDAWATARDNHMFDRTDNPAGRFLLVDQENWWGLVDSPVDIDVTFSRTDASSTNREQITVNFQRKITNSLKAGTVKAEILSVRQDQGFRKPYQLVSKAVYPGWTEFSNWYHQPTRVVVDFRHSGLH